MIINLSRKAVSNLLALFSLFLALVYIYGAGLVWGQTLLVEVKGIRTDNGLVYVTIYDDPKAFETSSTTSYVTYTAKEATGNPVIFTFNRLHGGPFALSIFHDENSNGIFDLVDQLPREGWGYSNNVGADSYPCFRDASFSMDDEDSNMTIQMNYAN